MSIPSDEVDLLISRLAGPLDPSARRAFRQAAEAALANVPCAGEGSFYRAVAPLQRAFFDPPSDWRASWDIAQEMRASKLRAGPAIGWGLGHDRVRHSKAAG